MRRKTDLILLAVVTALNCTTRGATWYVDDDPVDGCTTSDPLEDGSALYPFDSIQEALDAAADGDTIIVQPGTYTGECNRELDFKGKDLLLQGDACNTTIIDCESAGRAFVFDDGEPSTATVQDLTITRSWDNVGGAVYCENDSNPTFERCCFLDNEAYLTSGGAVRLHVSSPTFIECSFQANVAGGDGGAIYSLGGEPVLAECTFVNNFASGYGGAVKLLSGADAIIIGCEFTLNEADQAGALFVDNSSDPLIVGCQIAHNQADGDAGGMYVDRGSEPIIQGCVFLNNVSGHDGGALAAFESSVTIADSVFADNTATEVGGGLYAELGSLVVESTDFRGNAAGRGGGAAHFGISDDDEFQVAAYRWCRFIDNDAEESTGGGLYLDSTEALIHNCGFYGNEGSSGGGGMNVTDHSDVEVANTVFSRNRSQADSPGGGLRVRYSSFVKLVNSTLSRNKASGHGGGVSISDADLLVLNSILWNNEDIYGDACEAQIHSSGTSAVGVARSDVMDTTGACSTWSTGSNFSADPLFLDDDGPDDVVGTEDDDLRIDAGSPCIDRSNNNAMPEDVQDLDLDADLVEPLPLDRAGGDRFLDDPETGDIGIGHAVAADLPIADVGAFEYMPPPCPWDLDGDGEVGTSDFLVLLGAWDDYDTSFMLALFGHWGPCP